MRSGRLQDVIIESEGRAHDATSRMTQRASTAVRRGQGQVFAFRLKRLDNAIPAEYASDN
jgi:hypothetical protein